MLMPVELDSTSEGIPVAGLDWVAWLDQPYRFAAYAKDWETDVITKDDVIKIWAENQAISVIIDELVLNLCSASAMLCVQLDTAFFGDEWFVEPAISINLGEPSVLNKIKELGALQEPLGYEFYLDAPNKMLNFYFGRQFAGTPESAVIDACVTYFAPSIGNVIDMKWANNGPIAITTIGQPPQFPGFKGYSTYAPSALVYRDWWQFKSIGKALSKIARQKLYVDAITDSYGTHDRNPQKDLTITFNPCAPAGDDVIIETPLFWFQNRTGYIIHVDSEDWFLNYHRVDAFYWVAEQTLSHDEAGNWKCICKLEQVY
jgi:hypothetical protein